MMGKIVRRLMLDGIYAVGRNESWFADMSKIIPLALEQLISFEGEYNG